MRVFIYQLSINVDKRRRRIYHSSGFIFCERIHLHRFVFWGVRWVVHSLVRAVTSIARIPPRLHQRRRRADRVSQSSFCISFGVHMLPPSYSHFLFVIHTLLQRMLDHFVELPGALDRERIVTSTDERATDKYLRHSAHSCDGHECGLHFISVSKCVKLNNGES